MNTTTTAPEATMTELSTLSPVEFDTILAGLFTELARINQTVEARIEALHRVAGDRKVYMGRIRVWKMMTSEVIEATTGTVEAGAYEAAVAVRRAKQDEIDVMDAEYATRPWNRFFEVTSSNGHVHATMSCSTCNNGRFATDFGWHPQLSGLTAADAVAQLGEFLCSVCFPEAPVAWRRDRAEVRAEARAAAPKKVAPVAFAEVRWTSRHGYKNHEVFKTQRMAQQWAVAQVADAQWGYEVATEAVAHVRALLEAAGLTPAEFDAKVAAKQKRDAR